MEHQQRLTTTSQVEYYQLHQLPVVPTDEELICELRAGSEKRLAQLQHRLLHCSETSITFVRIECQLLCIVTG